MRAPMTSPLATATLRMNAIFWRGVWIILDFQFPIVNRGMVRNRQLTNPDLFWNWRAGRRDTRVNLCGAAGAQLRLTSRKTCWITRAQAQPARAW